MAEKIERSPEMVKFVYFLHRYLRTDDTGRLLPPEEFGDSNWTDVYSQFYSSLNDGRSFKTFKGSAEGLRKGNISGYVDHGIALLPKYDSILRTWVLKPRNEQWADLQKLRRI